MDFEFHPYQGVGEITFGMRRDEVRRLFSAPFRSFRRTPISRYPCDHFGAEGVFVYYKGPGVVEAVEFTDPARLLFHGRDLLGVSFENLIGELENVDSDLDVNIEEASLTSYECGISAYVPDAVEDPDRPAESIIVFERGYF